MRLAYPNEILESACKKFKIKNIKVHGLRHTHASMLFAAGARMKDVQKRLGHSQISTTMDIYTHITKQSEKNLSNLLADYIESCENTHENFNDNNED
ncbi:tyrosine-type recombinase/integrase [Ureibacillus sp. FSL K6-0165]|uniref:tyrosine-type recombinase/integrase n=1 Tax=Ureibacillus sp. FSL K6-0165 TaxID=2954606 RepID=UPI0030FC2C84